MESRSPMTIGRLAVGDLFDRYEIIARSTCTDPANIHVKVKRDSNESTWCIAAATPVHWIPGLGWRTDDWLHSAPGRRELAKLAASEITAEAATQHAFALAAS